MTLSQELYKQVTEDHPYLEPCPVCGVAAELWQYSKDFKDGPIQKVVMCTNGERFDPQDCVQGEGCLLYMPPDSFYRGRIIEAVKYWNAYAKAIKAQRHKRNWERCKPMRTQEPKP